MKILCIVNDKYSPPGLVGDALEEKGAELILVSPHAGEALPETLPADTAGLMVLGGIMHAFEDDAYPQLATIASLMRQAHQTGIPVLGICLGAQLLARALGRDRVTMPAYEFGFVELEMTEAGRRDRLLRGLAVPEIMQGHEDNFDLPEGAELLLIGSFCEKQAYRAGQTSYGFQCHFEVTAEMLDEWIRQARSFLANRLGDDPQGFLDRVAEDAPKKLPAAADFAREVSGRWLQLVRDARNAASA